MTSADTPVEELRAAIREVLEHASESYLARIKAGSTADAERELWGEIASLGWLGLSIEERHGGLALGFAGVAVLHEETGRALAPLPVLPTLLAAEALTLSGTNEAKAEWLPRIASGEVRAALALPLAGESMLRLAGDGCVAGTVPHVLRGDALDVLLLPVRADTGRVSLAIVGGSDEGVTLQSTPAVDPTRMLCAATLDGVRVDSSRVLHPTDAHWNHLLDHASVALACDSVGGAAQILDRTIDYMGVRTQFGRPIGSFQALKHRVAAWKIQLEGARALTAHAAQLLAGEQVGASAAASAAKSSACEVYLGIAGDSIQLHGGIGFTWEHDCHLYMKRARLNAALFGTPVQHRERVASLAFAEILGPQFQHRRLLDTQQR